MNWDRQAGWLSSWHPISKRGWPVCLQGHKEGQWDEELPSVHSRTALKCFSGSLQNTWKRKTAERLFQIQLSTQSKSQIKCACVNICVKPSNYTCITMAKLAGVCRLGKSRVQAHLNTCLNLRELVHDGKNGFHWASTAQIRLVSHKDDGNSDITYEDKLTLNTTLSWFVLYNNEFTIQVIMQYKTYRYSLTGSNTVLYINSLSTFGAFCWCSYNIFRVT